MKRLPFLSLATVVALGAIAAGVACGGISDPTKGSGERVATVSGALTGMAVPANTRVALVWKAGEAGGYAVGSDVAVVNGKFTMDLSAPPSSYFFAAESDYEGLSGSGSSEPPMPDSTEPGLPKDDSAGGSTSSSSGASGSSTSGGGQSFAFGSQLSPRDTVSGQINQPLSVAVAGFVVYVDTNGNGKLDIEGPYAKPTDDVIGGNKELLLAYLRDGGALDYEKLRDRSGILPQAGYNLAWDEGRWLPLNVVELKLSAKTKLPGAVCSGSGTSSFDEPPSPRPSSSSSGGPGSTGYPDPNDPNLICSSDGRSFSYTAPCADPAPSPPQPEGLCASSYSVSPSGGCGGVGYGSAIPDGEPAPEGWPCTVVNTGDAGVGDIDAGPAPGSDAGAGQ